jgi:hypothetical protein
MNSTHIFLELLVKIQQVIPGERQIAFCLLVFYRWLKDYGLRAVHAHEVYEATICGIGLRVAAGTAYKAVESSITISMLD